MKRIALVLTFLALALPGLALAGTWELDPAHTNVGFKVRHFFSKVPGEFTDFSGTIEFDPAKPADAKVNVVIKTASITTNHEKRDGHLRSDDFFAAEKHPEITFKSTKVTKKDEDTFLVEGLLTMRGVEKPITLETEFLGAGPAGSATKAGFTATTKIDRKLWGVSWNKTLDQGSAMLSDEVEIFLDIEATLQTAEGE